ncbi:hypothetical protein V495_01344 [Pseudogymnoascus sp. VKM F-4514 (FW-929)]|nr:hypothetical protein V495_01344 [Pseudogymnoascus sp. VKM F-4514 (FW-929)]KFY63395.1 hypothetical protein V497_02037 [Pseudogymnoascus sp. VKM F-4516 (FW-969)]
MTRLLIIWSLLACTVAAAPGHFRLWFPQYGPTFEGFVRKCGATYDAYRNDVPCHPHYVGCQSGRMIHCLLSQATESLKANMASAGVILGLLPTTLCLVGLSTVETGLLAHRRPLLSLLLAAGAPAISPSRIYDYRDSIDLLRDRSSYINTPKFTPMWAAIIATLQYIFASLAIANLAYVSWELSIKTVCSFSSDTAFQPALWAFVAIPIHLMGRLAVALRFRCQMSELGPEGPWARRLREEFQLTARQSPATLHSQQEGYLFILCSWCTSTGAVLHIMYGTLVFSSILFISAQDAIKVAARYLCSTLICRIILKFEIIGMRGVMEIEKESKA